MTVRYLHVREIDEYGTIAPKGGVTIAYTVTEELESICAVYVKCRPDELFCYKTGRAEALKVLQGGDEKRLHVIELDHPVSHALVDWLGNEIWPEGPACRGMGFAIDIAQDDRGRWLSDFVPSQSQVEFTPDVPLDDIAFKVPNYAEDDYAG